MIEWLQDLRLGTRALIRSPLFSGITLLTLALAIGVNSAIFSLVSLVLIRDLPLKNIDQLAFVRMIHSERGLDREYVSVPDFLDLREGVAAFDDLAAMSVTSKVLTGVAEPARVTVAEVTVNQFSVWGQTPVLGRDFLPDEDRAAERVATLSHGAWVRRFGADPNILGRILNLDGFATTIVGVMDQELEYGNLAAIELWRPLVVDLATAKRDQRDLLVTARLTPGTTIEQAHEEADALTTRLAQAYPETNLGWSTRVRPAKEDIGSQAFWTVFFLLILTVIVVMLIACSNVATLMLARAAGRSREMAVRAALGAGRWRILRQLLTESLILSLLAGAMGLLVARGIQRGLVWIVSRTGETGNLFQMLGLDRDVLLFTLSVAVLAPLFFGLLPAWHTARPDLRSALHESSGRASGSLAGQRTRRWLVGGQVAMALMLMVVTTLLVRAIFDIRVDDLGYDLRSVLTLRVELPEGKYADPMRQRQFYQQTAERIRALPEVAAAAWTNELPDEERLPMQSFAVREWPSLEDGKQPYAGVVIAEPAFFSVLGLEARQGRLLTEQDGEGGLPVALINQEAAERFWGSRDPLQEHFRLSDASADEPWVRIVGVIDNEYSFEPRQPYQPRIYLPLAQHPRPAMKLAMLTRGDTSSAIAPVRQQIWAVDAEQPISDILTLQQVVDRALAEDNALLALFAAFAIFALIMAAAGIYGVVSFAVVQRTREFGIRMALGAERGDLRGMVWRQSLGVLGGGLLIGLLGGFALARVLASGTPDVDAADPWTYVLVTALLLAVAAFSIFVPALRATRLDPVKALKVD